MSTIALVITFPIVLLLLLAALQAALYFHARNVAIKAGEEGLRQARSQLGGTAQGTAAAYAYIGTAGPTTLRTPLVVVTRTLRDARVEITGQPINLIPYLDLTIRSDQNGPVERITTPGGS